MDLALLDDFLTPAQRAHLEAFHDLFTEENHSGFLSSIRDPKEILIKHYVDSLLAGKMLAQRNLLPSPLMDLGSGGGFPGIPLGIQFPEKKIVLAEGRQSKAKFLEKAVSILNLKNVSVFSHQVNAKNFDGKFNGVITRALEPIVKTLGRFEKRAAPKDLFIFMKGPDVEKEIAAFQKNKVLVKKFKLKEQMHYVLPILEHRRSLIVIEKI